MGEANGVAADQLSEWVGENGVFDMIFEFSHVNLEFSGAEVWCKARDWSLTDLKKALTASQEATKNNGWYPIFFENHDKPRSIDHYFPEDADPVLAGKALGTVLLTLRGTPFIYQGQELGMRNVDWDSIDAYNDLNSRSQYETALAEGYTEEEAMTFVHQFSRDNARTPMQWDSSSQAGFTTGTPWLPVHENYETVNTEAEQEDSGSVLSWYRKLADLRADTPALIDGAYEELFKDSEEIYAFTREDGSDKLLIVVNFTGQTVTFDKAEAGLEGNDAAEILLSNYEGTDHAAGTLRPYEAQIIRVK